MRTTIVEATTGPQGNHGKFLVGCFDAEWSYFSALKSPVAPVLDHEGWTPDHLLVLDLATGEAALFRPGGSARDDLDKHGIWVCPMYEGFLVWLWDRYNAWVKEWSGRVVGPVDFILSLPPLVELTFDEAPFSWTGYRRSGPSRAASVALGRIKAIASRFREESKASLRGSMQAIYETADKAYDPDDHRGYRVVPVPHALDLGEPDGFSESAEHFVQTKPVDA